MVGVIRRQKKDGRRGKDFDYHEVWFEEQRNCWHLNDERVIPYDDRMTKEQLLQRIAELERENARLREILTRG